MFNIVFSPEYAVVPRAVASLRQGAGLSQRELAAVLNRSQSHVYKMESGQRPVELVEFCRIARAAGVEPLDALRDLLAGWETAGLTYAPALRSEAVQ